MRVSQRGIDLIKQFEGCRLSAYKDPVGVPTIGYGHTAGVKLGDKITQEQAEELLRDDLVLYEKKVLKYSKYNFNQNQFDALVSFAYNIGSIDQLTSNGRRSIKTISDKILEYNKAGGKKLDGLVRRRKAEKALFDEAVEGDSSAVEPKTDIPTPTAPKPQENAQTSPYKVGQAYTVSVKSALNVRRGAGKQYAPVGYRNLTPDGRKHANASGALLNGTKVTVQEVKNLDSSIWVKIPSGWICARDGSKIFVK